MKPREYRAILKRVGLTQSWVGETLANSSTTGRRWALGMHPIPKSVAIILRLIDAGKIAPGDAAKAQEPPEP